MMSGEEQQKLAKQILIALGSCLDRNVKNGRDQLEVSKLLVLGMAEAHNAVHSLLEASSAPTDEQLIDKPEDDATDA